MGDYYRGDPGFFSFLGKIGKAAVGFIPGVGGVASKAITAIEKVGGSKAGAIIKAGVSKHPVLSAAGAAAAVGGAGAIMGRGSMAGAGMGAMAGRGGHHPSARHLRALAMGLKRAKPRMNPCNPRALRRAIRRTHSFARLAMKTIHLVHPKKRARFGGFKKKRKR